MKKQKTNKNIVYLEIHCHFCERWSFCEFLCFYEIIKQREHSFLMQSFEISTIIILYIKPKKVKKT